MPLGPHQIPLSPAVLHAVAAAAEEAAVPSGSPEELLMSRPVAAGTVITGEETAAAPIARVACRLTKGAQRYPKLTWEV